MKSVLLSVLLALPVFAADSNVTNYWPTNLTGGVAIPTFLPIPGLTPGEVLTNVTFQAVARRRYKIFGLRNT